MFLIEIWQTLQSVVFHAHMPLLKKQFQLSLSHATAEKFA